VEPVGEEATRKKKEADDLEKKQLERPWLAHAQHVEMSSKHLVHCPRTEGNTVSA
jgi:hypothetical protein